ncbi:DUF6221 family protein [Streptomyces sp. NPDC059928]|uniref:DUF6221 family protein n=1 Tax=unclassified Streptomyces TaxID=2593676 RepID=UPI00364EC95C
MTDPLVQFIRDRLDEDSAAATKAGADAWRLEAIDRSGGAVFASGERPIAEYDSNPERRHAQNQAAADFHQAAHIVRHNPARSLVNIDAKRQLLGRYEAMESGVLVMTGAESILSEYRRIILPSLAEPYAGHPDYREEWRP